MDETPKTHSRRAFIKMAASTAALGARPLNKLAQTEDIPPTQEEIDRIPLSQEQAVNLLENKVDAEIFDRADIMNRLKERLKIHLFTKLIKIAAHEQIRGAVQEFSQKNPWDASINEIYERIRPESLVRRYKERVSRRFYQVYVDAYDKVMKEPEPLRSRDVTDRFAEIEKILGKSMGEQLEYRPTQEWLNIPDYRRPKLDIDHMLHECGISPSVFIITAADLKNVGVNVNEMVRLERERAKSQPPQR